MQNNEIADFKTETLSRIAVWKPLKTGDCLAGKIAGIDSNGRLSTISLIDEHGERQNLWFTPALRHFLEWNKASEGDLLAASYITKADFPHGRPYQPLSYAIKILNVEVA